MHGARKISWGMLHRHEKRKQLIFHAKDSQAGLSASRVGGSLTLAWAAWAGYVPDCITIIKNLARQNFYASNVV